MKIYFASRVQLTIKTQTPKCQSEYTAQHFTQVGYAMYVCVSSNYR